MVTAPSILIVDDNPTGQQIIRGMLFEQNYELNFASNGQEALQQVDHLKPDLLLLDVMMPGLDGFEVCQQLKANEEWQHIPVILVTALNSKEDLVHGLNVGADDFISKPVNGLELRARIRSMLRIKKQYDKLKKQQRELKASFHLNQKFSEVFAQHLEALEIVHHTGIRLMNNLNMDSVLDLVSQAVLIWCRKLRAVSCICCLMTKSSFSPWSTPTKPPASWFIRISASKLLLSSASGKSIRSSSRMYSAGSTANPLKFPRYARC